MTSPLRLNAVVLSNSAFTPPAKANIYLLIHQERFICDTLFNYRGHHLTVPFDICTVEIDGISIAFDILKP